MKNLIFSLLLFSSFVSLASHVYGGFIGVAQTNSDSTTVALTLMIDTQTPVIPSSLYVEKWEKNSVGWYVQNGVVEVTQAHQPFMFQGNYLITYTSNYLDLDSNQYRFIYRNCCWGMLNNSTNSMNSEFIVATDYWHMDYNSTPFMINPLFTNMQVNTRNTMSSIWGNVGTHFNKMDPFDVVNISSFDLLGGYANGTFVPQIYTTLTNFTVSNDSISWVPTTLGKYGVGFIIDDYRNGDKIGQQRIQWTFTVVPSTIGIDEFTRRKKYQVFDWMGNYLGVDIPYSNLKGFYVFRYEDGNTEKVFVQ